MRIGILRAWALTRVHRIKQRVRLSGTWRARAYRAYLRGRKLGRILYAPLKRFAAGRRSPLSLSGGARPAADRITHPDGILGLAKACDFA